MQDNAAYYARITKCAIFCQNARKAAFRLAVSRFAKRGFETFRRFGAACEYYDGFRLFRDAADAFGLFEVCCRALRGTAQNDACRSGMEDPQGYWGSFSKNPALRPFRTEPKKSSRFSAST